MNIQNLILTVVAIVIAVVVVLWLIALVLESEKARERRERIAKVIAEEEAKRGIKPEGVLPWYFNPAVADLTAEFSGTFGFWSRVSDFFVRLGNSLLGLVKTGLGGISTFMKSRAVLFGSAGRKLGVGQWRERLLTAAQMVGFAASFLVAGLGFVLLAVFYALIWLLVLIPAASSWALSAISGQLNREAEEIKTKWAEREEIRAIRQKPELTPDGIIFYNEVEDSVRTGKLYKGFLPKDALETAKGEVASPPSRLVLLINGSGFLFGNPERLRRHTRLVEKPGGSDEKEKVEVSLYDEPKIFEDLSGAGALFGWRSSKWRLLNSGNCEVQLHGTHPHFRSVTLVPFERVRYWLATMAAEEGEENEGPNEVLLVEEVLGSWGEHQGVLKIFAWTGIELPEGEVEEARVFLSSFNPEEIKPAIPAYAID